MQKESFFIFEKIPKKVPQVSSSAAGQRHRQAVCQHSGGLQGGGLNPLVPRVQKAKSPPI